MSPRGELGFTRAADGGYLVHLGEVERTVLAEVADQVIELLGGAEEAPADQLHPLQTVRLQDGPVPVPLDGALHRLLPDGSRGDPALAAEFRRLTERDLRATKTAHLSLLRALLAEPDAVLPSTDAGRVAAAMTDLRLVIAERLGVQTEADSDELYELTVSGGDAADPDDGMRLALATVCTVLGILLESLIELMTDELP
jgi:hypothetical protein